MFTRIIVLFAISCAGFSARADDGRDLQMKYLSDYVRKVDLIKKVENPEDVLRVWYDLTMVYHMIKLDTDDVLSDAMRVEISRRLSASLTNMHRARSAKSDQIVLLSDISLLFTTHAIAYREGKLSYTAFTDAGQLLTSRGSYALARFIEAAVTKPGEVIPPEKSIKPW